METDKNSFVFTACNNYFIRSKIQDWDVTKISSHCEWIIL